MPEECRSRSWMMIGRSGGTRSSRGLTPSPTCSTPTLTSAKAGMYFESGSDSDSLPSSTSVIAATAVIGFDIE